MLNVMIVEDEMLVRLGFKNTVPWGKYGMTVCADVSNGREAWRYYCAGGARPDIVITDIMMPEMDGLELIRNIRQRDSRTRIVILSCLEDFHLVRQAMNMGVSNYILKLTMTKEEIDDVLSQVREELGTQESIETSKGMIRNPDYLKQNVMTNFVFYNLYSEDEFSRHIANLKLRLQPERLVVCMMEIDRFEQMQRKFMDEKGELIRATILNVLDELLDQSGRGEAVSDRDMRYLLLFSFKDMVSEARIREELNGILTLVQKVMRRFFNISVTIGVSGMKSEFASLRALYRESASAVERKFYYGAGHLLFPERLEADSEEAALNRVLAALINEWPALEDNERQELDGIVRSFRASGQANNERDIRKLFVRLLHWPVASMATSVRDAAALVYAYGEQIRNCETLDEIATAFKRFQAELAMLSGSKLQLSKEIAQAVQFVQQHYDHEISLPQLADRLEMSPSYLSGLFKKELRINFSDYVNRVRVEKAKELLLNTNLKSYEIAERTGFADDSYFSRTFLKHVGVRPNGFRRLWIQDNIAGAAGDDDGE